MEGAATRFSLGRIDVGAPEEGSNGYIVGNKNLSQAWGKEEEGIFCFFSSHNLWAAQGSYRKHPCRPVLRPEDTAWDVHRGLGLLFQFLGMMDYFLHLLLLSPAMHLSCHTDLANMNVYVYIYGFRYKNGWGWREVYLSTLPSPDAFSICKYLQTAMSGIYVKVTMPELAVQLFQSAPYQSCAEINEMDDTQIQKTCILSVE